VILAINPAAMRHAGTAQAIFPAIVRGRIMATTSVLSDATALE